ncbi:kanadaptin isoform X4 [Gallus gallus]|uniref:kanadaptin isoform X4 n=1 Tax=Gallus gallus TaxID=9031 RepID=UPI001F01499B|nr:kanadaptin isoform X4 [Gallus gallus]
MSVQQIAQLLLLRRGKEERKAAARKERLLSKTAAQRKAQSDPGPDWCQGTRRRRRPQARPHRDPSVPHSPPHDRNSASVRRQTRHPAAAALPHGAPTAAATLLRSSRRPLSPPPVSPIALPPAVAEATGPEEDQESESELTMTQLKALRKQQQAKLEKTMLGEDSDEEDEKEERGSESSQNVDMSCSWGMGEDAEEDEAEENPIAIEFQDVQDAFYMKDPRKALQGFFDREGEELEYEYDDRGHNSWLCRVKLPVDDALGKQLVAEVLHSGKKKEAMIQCALEACRLLDARGVLRQEAVSRKRKSKNWEDEDFYDSDDDTFLDRTGAVEKKRLNRMKKAGKIEEKPETYDSLVAKLKEAENELSEITEKLKASGRGQSQPAAQDSLDEFMTEIKSGSTLDSVTRKKLHLRSFELKKEQQRLKGLIKLVKPTELPELKPPTGSYSLEANSKSKKITLPLFGAMKGGSKFKLKTGSLGKLPDKRPHIPESLLKMKDDGPEEEEEEEEEEIEEEQKVDAVSSRTSDVEMKATVEEETGKETNGPNGSTCNNEDLESLQDGVSFQPEPKILRNKSQMGPSQEKSQASEAVCKESRETSEEVKKSNTSSKYPDDDPDYCIWIPPADQSGDGKTHLNDKYGY